MKRFWLVVVCASAASLCGTAEETTTTGAPTTGAPTTAAPTTAPSGTETTAASTGEKEVIGVCLPALDNPLMLEIKDTFEKRFGQDYDVQVSSADGNPNTQATQVENYTAMGAKFIIVMAVEATSLLPKLEAAREAGVMVMVIGGEPGESGRDAVMKMDQFLAGEYCALMAQELGGEDLPRCRCRLHRDGSPHLVADHRSGPAHQRPADDQRALPQELGGSLHRRDRRADLGRKEASTSRASPRPIGSPTRSSARPSRSSRRRRQRCSSPARPPCRTS